tara:strand:- start:2209 stop:3243 length:1035 start_codon:yes stop_codon:yes gene_type:complete
MIKSFFQEYIFNVYSVNLRINIKRFNSNEGFLSMSKTILLTGATGFVGSALLKTLSMKSGRVIKSVIRRSADSNNTSFYEVGPINAETDYSAVISNTDIVIHCAAYAHVAKKNIDGSSQFRVVNTDGTINLAYQAAQAGVKRFIFLSSIVVNGISSKASFTAFDTPEPVEGYPLSKLEAEIGLRRIAEETGMEVVIIRPPLVYGPNAPGNFGKLSKLVEKNFPLPLGAIHNKRSFVGLDNLVDLIITCIDHPNAANQTFLVSDDHDVSTTELLTRMIKATGKKPWLLPVPIYLFRLVGKMTGKIVEIDLLCGNLQVDISHTKKTLEWTPPISFDDGISKCFSKE